MLQSYYREGKTCKCQQQDIPYILFLKIQLFCRNIFERYLFASRLNNRNEKTRMASLEFFLNVFTKFRGKIFVITVKCLEPATSCVRCYHSTSKRHVRDRIFKLSLVHASMIYQIDEFAEFRESSVPFRTKKLHCVRFAIMRLLC